MKTKNVIIILISIMISAYLITSCKKNKDELLMEYLTLLL